jgi:endonuclease/exonuclease/phosphatase family metal-dependent hydrolase
VLTTIFGLQLIRALIPYLVFLLGGRLGWPPFAYAGLALILFGSAFLTPWLNQWLGLRRLLLVAAAGTGLLRLLVQVWTGDPLLDLVLVCIGTVLFIIFWPAYLTLVQNRSSDNGQAQQLVFVFLLGLCLDTALHGLFSTYDFIWRPGAGVLWLTTGLVLLLVLALMKLGDAVPAGTLRVQTTRTALPWLAIGPLLFLELVIFQNQARLAAVTGWGWPLAFAWVLVSQLAGLTLAVWWIPRAAGLSLLTLLLLVTLWPLPNPTVVTLATTWLLGQAAVAVVLAAVLRHLARLKITGSDSGRFNGYPAYGFGMLGLVILLFLFYFPFIAPVPYEPVWIPLLAGLVAGSSGLLAARATAVPARHQIPAMWVWSWLLLLIPAAVILTRPDPAPAARSSSGAVRIVNYNIQHGFGPSGQLDIEAVAQTIETQQPDVVTLQEVGRGWVTNGSLDVYSWLSQRLGMPYTHFHPASDAQWGQAVFSRFPIVYAETQPLPPAGLPLPRGFAYFEIETGQPEPLRLVNTHLHHFPWDSEVRALQIRTILDFLAARPFERLVITGDLNATPGSPEIKPLYERGLRDAVGEAGILPGYTFTSAEPHKRLDYILHSPDLTASQVVIPDSLASDHLGIAATILLEP